MRSKIQVQKRNYFWGFLIGVLAWLGGWYSHHFFSLPESLEKIDDSVFQQPLAVNPLPIKALQEKLAKPSIEPQQRSLSSIDQFTELLRHHQLDAVLARYTQVHDASHEQEKINYRQAVFVFVKELNQLGEVARALELLTALYPVEYKNLAYMLRFADALKRNTLYPKYIDILYEAKALAFRDQEIDQVTHRVRQAVSDLAQQLTEQKDETALKELYQKLIALEPSYAPYYIAMAKIHLILNEDHAAYETIKLIKHVAEVEAQVTDILLKLKSKNTQESPSNETIISMDRHGEHYIVTVTLDNTVEARLLLDTGASLTVIHPDIVQTVVADLASESQWQTFNTANGRRQAPVITLDSLSISDETVYDIAIGVFDLGATPGIDGLLGMNFLKHFRFFIDQENAKLHLLTRD